MKKNNRHTDTDLMMSSSSAILNSFSKDKSPNVQPIGFNIHANSARRPELVVGKPSQNAAIVIKPDSIKFNKNLISTPKDGA